MSSSSGYFTKCCRLKLDDVAFVESDGKRELTLTLDRRKNRPYRHPLMCPCTCHVQPKKGKAPLGVALCAYHTLESFLKSDPAYKLTQTGQLVGATMLQYVPQHTVNPMLKKLARACGDPHADHAGSHGMRRGMACDLALHGATLNEILVGGDWRSSAFRAYIESVKEDLASKALVQLCGECSDSDTE